MEFLKNIGVSRASLSDLARELQKQLRSLNKFTGVRVFVNPIPRQGFEVVTLEVSGRRKSTVFAAEDVLYHDDKFRARFRPGVAEDVARRVAII